jgi:hypothetical protein
VGFIIGGLEFIMFGGMWFTQRTQRPAQRAPKVK